MRQRSTARKTQTESRKELVGNYDTCEKKSVLSRVQQFDEERWKKFQTPDQISGNYPFEDTNRRSELNSSESTQIAAG